MHVKRLQSKLRPEEYAEKYKGFPEKGMVVLEYKLFAPVFGVNFVRRAPKMHEI